jgi:hypothetical protein
VVSTALLFSRRGAEEIINERDEERESTNRAKLAAAAEKRQELGRLRIPGHDVGDALQYFLLTSGEVLSAADRLGWYHPGLDASLDDVRAACTSYLKDLDDASASARYGAGGGADPAAIEEAVVRIIRSEAKRLYELRRIELPEGSDLDTLSQLDESAVEEVDDE